MKRRQRNDKHAGGSRHTRHLQKWGKTGGRKEKKLLILVRQRKTTRKKQQQEEETRSACSTDTRSRSKEECLTNDLINKTENDKEQQTLKLSYTKENDKEKQ